MLLWITNRQGVCHRVIQVDLDERQGSFGENGSLIGVWHQLEGLNQERSIGQRGLYLEREGPWVCYSRRNCDQP